MAALHSANGIELPMSIATVGDIACRVVVCSWPVFSPARRDGAASSFPLPVRQREPLRKCTIKNLSSFPSELTAWRMYWGSAPRTLIGPSGSVTESDHLPHLKAKTKKICGRTEIKKRFFYHDEDLIRSNPDFLDRMLPSLDARQDIAATAVPELAAAAATKAVAEWGRPASDITHLIFCTYSGTHMPGADLRLASLLSLSPSVQRTMLYYNGCNSSSASPRTSPRTTLIMFRAPDEAHIDTLVLQSLLGDGAGAVIVGSDPEACSERPLFEMVSSAQATVPGTQHAFTSKLGKCGFAYGLSGELPSLVAHNIEHCLVDAIWPLGLRCDWNDLFWVVHPGGRGILDAIEVSLMLEQSKLKASRWVLSEYGNMSGVTIIFVLDEMRRRLQKAAAHQDGENSMDKEEESKLGAMVAVGPGLTLETMLLRAIGN
ncbi:hypothetical protein BS78_K275200 [Paspalum vaginatum]|uniref:chalcone synthase n=1 Tax=Paspalum vaginatum TaxID=158149 RepID=A0A9W8CFH5_9POAL|nr:hypothetical protein BS78_K275200 [Paspalum vaginatum]